MWFHSKTERAHHSKFVGIEGLHWQEIIYLRQVLMWAFSWAYMKNI